MTIHYDDPSVQVTATTIWVDGNTYQLSEVDEVWHRQGSRSWRVLAGRGALGAALAAPIVAAVLGVILALWLDASVTVTVAIVGVATLAGLGVGPLADTLFEYFDRSYARGSRQRELWIRWRGAPVQLLSTGDSLRFGQIYRALQRAMENLHSQRRR
ncbi:DUF6232 family protein [Micromonospora sp. SH-82]|uniref:DUF6232 family protein n=1 Tax=Micromonospora sp. SH-82 TaxID=3132938 RepID=UPI003EB79187